MAITPATEQKTEGQKDYTSTVNKGGYIFLAIVIIIALFTYFYIIPQNEKKNQEKADLEKQLEEMNVNQSPIYVGKARVKPNENVSVYIKKDVFPKEGKYLALYSLSTKTNYTAIDVESCKNNKPKDAEVGCIFTMPEEGKYVFRLMDEKNNSLLESNEILVDSKN